MARFSGEGGRWGGSGGAWGEGRVLDGWKREKKGGRAEEIKDGCGPRTKEKKARDENVPRATCKVNCKGESRKGAIWQRRRCRAGGAGEVRGGVEGKGRGERGGVDYKSLAKFETPLIPMPGREPIHFFLHTYDISF